MARIDDALNDLSSENVRRTMIVVPVGLAVWLAGEKVLHGTSQQEIINACIYHARKHGQLANILSEYQQDVASLQGASEGTP